MSIDTGVDADRIRNELYNLHQRHVYLVTDVKNINTVREALNAYANLNWFFKHHRSAYSVAEAGELVKNAEQRWRELSLEKIMAATRLEEVLEILKESPKDFILYNSVVASKVSLFYKIE